MDRWLPVQLAVLEIDMCLQCALYETFNASRLIEIGWYTYLLEQSPWNLLESCFQVCPD